MGGPKALLIEPGGRPWLQRAVEVLQGAGIDDVVVVLGAAPHAADLLAPRVRAQVRVTVAEDWSDGPDATLRAGLLTLAQDALVTSAVVSLVDLPDLVPPVVRRVLDATGGATTALGRATYGGRPGHPVVLGRDHWEAAPASRRALLAGADAVRVECGDLATGADLDRPTDLPPGTTRARAGADLPRTNRP
ncbi:NTP transferase domain-containing protein [Nocardioidaceae bacterium]|nr:NTP transferase domain-containing protein [Nocardioidaceae bacterium]